MKEFLKITRDRFLSPVLKAIIERKNETNDVIEKALIKSENLAEETNRTLEILRSEILKLYEFCDKNPSTLYMDAITTNRILTEKASRGIVEDYESVLEKHYTKLIKSGDSVIDIGAHEGRHLAVFINLVGDGNIFAFEPLKKQYGHLCKKFNKSNIKIYNVALSDSPGIMDFYENETYPEESGLKIRVYNNEGSFVSTTKINVTTLDQMASEFSKVDYIKLDAEGAEIQILNGRGSH